MMELAPRSFGSRTAGALADEWFAIGKRRGERPAGAASEMKLIGVRYCRVALSIAVSREPAVERGPNDPGRVARTLRDLRDALVVWRLNAELAGS